MSDDYFSDTIIDVESISDEDIIPYLIQSPQEGMDESKMEEQENGEGDLRTETKDETEEIVRGFILEKDIINQEHEKEKKELVECLMSEREDLIEKFKKQVRDIEKRIGKNEKGRKKPLELDAAKSEKGVPPLYIRLDRGDVISADEFMSRLKLEDKFESERDILERSFRDEKRLLKDRLQLEWDRKSHLESQRFESTVDDMARAIKKLRMENARLAKKLESRNSELKSRIEEGKSQWTHDKSQLVSNFQAEKLKLRETLERRHEKEMDSQRNGHERMLGELKKEYKEARRSMGMKEREVSQALSSVNDYEERTRAEIELKVQNEYKDLFDELGRENKRMSDQVDELNREKENLTGLIKDLREDSSGRMSIVEEFTSKLNREYEERLKRAVLENEKLKAKLEGLSNDNSVKDEALKDFRESAGRLEDELTLKNNLLARSDDAKEVLRREVNDFSCEIDALRREKDELQKCVDEYANNEKSLAEKMSEKEMAVEDAFDKCRISERERLSLERELALCSEELGNVLQAKEGLKKDMNNCDKETTALRRELGEERKEHDRLRQRFRRDAEEIRRKEGECRTLREQLRSRANTVERELTKDAESVDKLMTLEAENVELKKKLNENEEERDGLLRKERGEIQKQFAKEFAKRIHASKRNHEEEAEEMKNQIRLLRSKVTALEELLAVSCSKKCAEAKDNITAAEINEGDGIDMFLLSSHREKASTDGKESSLTHPPNMSVFDYASSHKQNEATSLDHGCTPANENGIQPSLNKRRNLESHDMIYQGSFSRQRSRSFDSISNISFSKNEAKNGLYSRRKELNTYQGNEAFRTNQNERTGGRSPPRYSNTPEGQKDSKDQITLDDAASRQAQHVDIKYRRDDDVTGLPPKYQSSANGYYQRLNGRPSKVGCQRYGYRDTDRLERSVEKLQERLEEGHFELLRRIEQMQQSVRR